MNLARGQSAHNYACIVFAIFAGCTLSLFINFPDSSQTIPDYRIADKSSDENHNDNERILNKPYNSPRSKLLQEDLSIRYELHVTYICDTDDVRASRAYINTTLKTLEKQQHVRFACNQTNAGFRRDPVQAVKQLCDNDIDNFHWFCISDHRVYVTAERLTSQLLKLNPKQSYILGRWTIDEAYQMALRSRTPVIFNRKALQQLCPYTVNCASKWNLNVNASLAGRFDISDVIKCLLKQSQHQFVTRPESELANMIAPYSAIRRLQTCANLTDGSQPACNANISIVYDVPSANSLLALHLAHVKEKLLGIGSSIKRTAGDLAGLPNVVL